MPQNLAQQIHQQFIQGRPAHFVGELMQHLHNVIMPRIETYNHQKEQLRLGFEAQIQQAEYAKNTFFEQVNSLKDQIHVEGFDFAHFANLSAQLASAAQALGQLKTQYEAQLADLESHNTF